MSPSSDTSADEQGIADRQDLNHDVKRLLNSVLYKLDNGHAARILWDIGIVYGKQEIHT